MNFFSRTIELYELALILNGTGTVSNRTGIRGRKRAEIYAIHRHSFRDEKWLTLELHSAGVQLLRKQRTLPYEQEVTQRIDRSPVCIDQALLHRCAHRRYVHSARLFARNGSHACQSW